MDKKLEAMKKRIDAGLREVKGWPLRTPGKAVLGHAAAMVLAAQEMIEKNGWCAHHVILLGDSQVRLNALIQHPEELGDRERIQQHKMVTWATAAQLFNVLDSDVMLWLNDSWTAEISPEKLESGDWEWPKDTPGRSEALQLNVITPMREATLMCVYRETETAPIVWGEFYKSNVEAGVGAFSGIMHAYVKEFRHLAPRDGQHRGQRLTMQATPQPADLVNRLELLGNHIAYVDPRFVNVN